MISFAITLTSNLKDFLQFPLENVVTNRSSIKPGFPGVSGTDFFRSTVEPILLKGFLWKLAKVLHRVNVAPLPKLGFCILVNNFVLYIYIDSVVLTHLDDFWNRALCKLSNLG